MTAPVATRRFVPHRSLARRWVRITSGDSSPTSPATRRRAFLAGAASLGICAGWLERATDAAQSALDPRITPEMLRTNVHILWMAPTANLVLFALAGLCLLPWIGRHDRKSKFACAILLFLTVFAGLRTVRGLHVAASLLLAAGLATAGARRANLYAFLTSPRMRAAFLLLSGLLLFVAVCDILGRVYANVPAPSLSAVAAPQKPNVLLIVMDTVRAQSLSIGPAPYTRDTTPNLRRLASRGINFTEARSTAPWTLPSHASMFTGKWPHELSVGVDRALDDREPTVAEALRDQGYLTAGFVANIFYCNARYGVARGFSHYDDIAANRAISPGEVFRSASLAQPLVDALTGERTPLPENYQDKKSAAEVNTTALAWLDRNRSPRQPFFLFLNYMDAHAPYALPAGAAPRFSSDGGRIALLESRQRSLYRRMQRAKREHRDDLVPDLERRATEVRSELLVLRRDVYEDCIAILDQQIDALLTQLDERNLLENTLVVITSDHGEHFNEHGLAQHGHSLYKPLIHVPLLIVGPRARNLPEGHVVSTPVSLRDLPATVVDLLGLTPSTPFPGASLRRHWDSEIPPPDATQAAVIAEVERQTKVKPTPLWPASYGAIHALVDPKFTYLRHDIGTKELYALTDDPDELRDLSHDANAASTLRQMDALLDQLLARPQGAR